MEPTTVSTPTHAQSADGTYFHVDRKPLDLALDQLLETMDSIIDRDGLADCSSKFNKMYKSALQYGLQSLRGIVSLPDHEAWADAMKYGREVIVSPQDSQRRALATWNRSCSVLCSELRKLFGENTIEAARSGCRKVISEHYHGERLSVAHIDKKASYLRHLHETTLCAGFSPVSSPLAFGCYAGGTLPCSLVLSSWLPAEQAIQTAMLSHVAVCDDHSGFTHDDGMVRARMVGLAAGVAYQHGGSFVNAFVDGTALQSTGSGSDLSIESAMAWRAVSGCTTVYSKFMYGECEIEEGLVAPMIMMATHDLLDWRSDTAVGNHENGVSAAFGMGFETPFHDYLEGMLRRTLVHPPSGVHAIAAMVSMHFTVSRYGSWEYHGQHASACHECVHLLRVATQRANFKWSPKIPPRDYAGGVQMREWGRLWVEQFENHGIVQEALSWFQYLIDSGSIWLFDVLSKDVCAVDDEADWA